MDEGLAMECRFAAGIARRQPWRRIRPVILDVTQLVTVAILSHARAIEKHFHVPFLTFLLTTLTSYITLLYEIICTD